MERDEPDRLLLLVNERDVQWVLAWVSSFPPGDKWASVLARTLREPVVSDDAYHARRDVYVDLAPDRWRDLVTYTEVAGGVVSEVPWRHFDRPVWALALSDTAPPALAGPPPATEPATEHKDRLVAIGATNVGWLLCWLRQHVGRHVHTAEELVGSLLAALPVDDEEMGEPLVCGISMSCWDDLVAFMGRHGYAVQEAPEECRLDGRPVWMFHATSDHEQVL